MADPEKKVVDIPQLRGRGNRIAARRIYREVTLASGARATQLVAAKGQPIPDHVEVEAGDVQGDKPAQDHAKRGPRQTARKPGPKDTSSS